MRRNDGITLIALVVVIIVLIILANTSLSMILGNSGIFNQIDDAKKQTEYTTAKEKLTLSIMNNLSANSSINVEQLKREIEVYNNKEQFPLKAKIDGYDFILTGDGNIYDITTLNDATKENMLSKTTNSAIEDKYGNIMIIPSGFKIVIDNTTSYQKDSIDVTKGIVIEDKEKNQFIWIPVGKINKEYEESCITFSRYIFGSFWKTYIDKDGNIIKIDDADKIGTPIDMGDIEIENKYLELENSSYGNTSNNDINSYKKSVLNNGGYYFGRYEARDRNAVIPRNSDSPNNNKIAVNKEFYVYNYISQNDAFKLSSQMYQSNNFKSILLNSYAWDTALLFVQTFGDKNHGSIYSDLRGKALSEIYKNKGNEEDKICNIFDMCGNYLEWSTETYYDENIPCVLRGSNAGSQANKTSTRTAVPATNATIIDCFRIILYLN